MAVASTALLGEWLPIATAPRDGTEILVWTGRAVVAAIWMSRDGDYPTWWPSHAGALWSADVTHWLPLPPPPNAHGEATPPEPL